MKKPTKLQRSATAAKDNARALVVLAAKGSEDAAVELYRTAALVTWWLNYLCGVKPEAFLAIAAKKMYWPVMWGAHRDTFAANRTFISQLKLASRTGFNFSSNGKSFSWNNPANQTAIYLHQLAQALRRAPISQWDEYEGLLLGSIGWRSANVAASDPQQLRDLEAWGSGLGQQLPPLTRRTSAEWAKATPRLFRLVYGKHFDKYPRLKELRNSVVRRAKNGSGKQGGPGVVRQAMLQAVKQAWHSIATLD